MDMSMHKYSHYIDGKFVDSASGTWFDSFNLYTGEPWSKVAQGDAEDVERAVSFMSPFGGYRDSGIGRENGIDAIREYLQVKSVCIDTGAVSANPFVMR